MPSIKAIETDVGPALAEFSAHLWSLRVPHRIFDTAEGRQVLVVGSEAHARLAQEHFLRWMEGTLPPPEPSAQKPVSPGVIVALRACPVTALSLLLSLLGTLLVFGDENLGALHWLTFTDIHRVAGNITMDTSAATYARGEYWRLVTPVFLHFGLLHAAFNMLWTWELGRRLERARGSSTLLALIVLAGAGGNIAQYMVEPGAIFGGMSGVIYAFLGYSWAWSRLTGDPATRLPSGLLGFMVGWLLFCMSGVQEALGFGAVANAVHVAGLLLGVALGAGAGLLYSRPNSAGP